MTSQNQNQGSEFQNFKMIDVGEKAVTRRIAVTTGKIRLHPKAIQMVKSGVSPKGNILAMAEVAGIMAAKNTSAILPLCHPLALDSVRIWFEVNELEVQGFCETICHGKTGVEMEAMTGLSVALLTVYDLAKVVDPEIEMSEIYLIKKEGGKSGQWRSPIADRKNQNLGLQPQCKSSSQCSLTGVTFAVLTLSDRASQKIYEDKAGPILSAFCKEQEAIEVSYEIIPDQEDFLRTKILTYVEKKVDLVLLTGGTGIGPRDVTVEALRAIASKELSGLGEAQRVYGARYTSSAWLSRSTSFVIGSTLVVLFPGSPKAVAQGLEAIGNILGHAVKMVRGKNHD